MLFLGRNINQDTHLAEEYQSGRSFGVEYQSEYSFGEKYQSSCSLGEGILIKMSIKCQSGCSFTGGICLFNNCIVQMGNSGCLPRESKLRQNRATQPTVHAGYFSVSIIRRTLAWTTGYLTLACDLFAVYSLIRGILLT